MASSKDTQGRPVKVSDFMTGGWIDMKLTESGTQFLVHRDLLCHYSPYFRNLLNGKFAEASGKTVNVESNDVCDKATVSSYVDWLYRGGLDTGNLTSEEMHRMANLYIFGDKYDTPILRRQILERLHEVHKNQYGSTPPIPLSTVVNIYNHLPESSSMRKLLVDIYVSGFKPRMHPNGSVNEVATAREKQELIDSDVPREFLVEALFRASFFRTLRHGNFQLLPFANYHLEKTKSKT